MSHYARCLVGHKFYKNQVDTTTNGLPIGRGLPSGFCAIMGNRQHGTKTNFEGSTSTRVGLSSFVFL